MLRRPRMKCIPPAIFTFLVLAVGTASAQSPLTAYEYVVVVPPVYDSEGTDIYGLAGILHEQLRRDRSWKVIGAIDELGTDRSKVLRALHVGIEHPVAGERKSSVTLVFVDVAGTVIQRVDGAGGSWVWAAESNLRKALNNAITRLKQIRRSFDPGQIPELSRRINAVDRMALAEPDVRAYLDQNQRNLSPIEGIWTEAKGQYRLGVLRKKDSPVPDRFVAVVLEAKHPMWEPGMVKATFDRTSASTMFSGTYRLGFHTDAGVTATLDGAMMSIPLPPRDGKEEKITFLKAFPVDSVGNDPAPTIGGSKVSGSGTGFVVGPDLIATNFHVVDGGSAWNAFFPATRQTYKLELVVSDKANDLAILRMVRDSNQSPVPALKVVGSDAARLGDEVYTLGFPLGDLLGTEHKLGTGVLSATSGIAGDPRMFQITVPVQPGNSGGPIINSNGDVVGVLASTLSVEYLYRTQQHVPQNVNFAIKGDYLSFLLRQAVLPETPWVTRDPAGS